MLVGNSFPEMWSEKLLNSYLDSAHMASNPPIVTDKDWGTAIVAKPHTIKIQRDMNGLIRSMVVGDA